MIGFSQVGMLQKEFSPFSFTFGDDDDDDDASGSLGDSRKGSSVRGSRPARMTAMR